jgi:hypothetical protein
MGEFRYNSQTSLTSAQDGDEWLDNPWKSIFYSIFYFENWAQGCPRNLYDGAFSQKARRMKIMNKKDSLGETTPAK